MRITSVYKQKNQNIKTVFFYRKKKLIYEMLSFYKFFPLCLLFPLNSHFGFIVFDKKKFYIQLNIEYYYFINNANNKSLFSCTTKNIVPRLFDSC
jgi:hypothetical protein